MRPAIRTISNITTFPDSANRLLSDEWAIASCPGLWLNKAHIPTSNHPPTLKPIFTKALFLLAFVGLTNAGYATIYHVGTLSDLSAKISSAVAGDQIILSNGVYTASSTISVSRTGTAANPILICAQSIGGAEITGSGSGISMSSSASYIIVQGFKLTHSSGISIPHGATHIQYTRNIVQLTIPATNTVSYFNISADDVTIDHNELRNKSTLGEMLDISGSGSQVARRLWVHHNYFHDFSSPGGNGAETIRWGLSGLSLSTGNGLCEYNLFKKCEGENELISNKSSGNTYRYNTFRDSIGAEMSQRHGNDCLYYGNYFTNSQGMRIYGDRHKIFCNYFENCNIAVNMGNGDGDIYNGAALTAHDRPDDNQVMYNTFVGNGTHYEMGGRTGGLGSSNTVFADNIFLNGGNMASISSSAPYTGTWTNNIRWNTSTAGNMPATGYVTEDPKLVRDASGAMHIQSGSPAINAGKKTFDFYGNAVLFTNVTIDMDGQPRDGTNDIGADEFSTAPIIAHIMTTNDVGPFSDLTNSGSFSLSASPASQLVAPGNVANYTVSLVFNNGFTNAVALSVSNLPATMAAVFNPASVTNTGNATLTITTSNTTPQATYMFTIRGIGGGLTNTATVTLIVTTSTVAQPGVLLWTGLGGSTTWNQQSNWLSLTSVGSGTPGVSNDVLFANVAVVGSQGTVDSVIDSDMTIQSLTFTNFNGYHTVQINPGCTLTILGTNGYQGNPSLNVGMDVYPPNATNNVWAGFTGDGTLAISNTNASVQVRQGFGSGLVGTTATLDMSGLGTFNADMRRFQIGSESGTPRRVAGIVYLARTNFITLEQVLDVNTTNWSSGTPALVLGHNTNAGNTNGSQLFLGIQNNIYVNNIVSGRGNQTNNLITFNPAFLGSSPSVTFRGSDGTSRVGQWTIGDNSAGSLASSPTSGTNDFTGGNVDALVDRLLVGRGRSGNTVNTGIGVLTFDTGTIDANIVRLGTMVDESSSTNASGVGTLNVNGSATLVVNTVLELAHTNTTAVAAASAIAGMRGTLNVNGGIVAANIIASAGGTSVVALNNGTLELTGTAGTPAAPLTTLNTTNSIFHLNLNGSAIATNIVATTLNASGFNVVIIDTAINLAGTQTFPLVSYGTLNGPGSFTLGDLPDGVSGGLVNDPVHKTIDMVLTSSTNAIPQIASLSLSGTSLAIQGTNGAPYGTYNVLSSTNLTLSFDQWTVLSTGTFDPAGRFSVTNSIDPNVTPQFFQIQEQ